MVNQIKTAAKAHMHAMSNRDINESPDDAKVKADLYVRDMFSKQENTRLKEIYIMLISILGLDFTPFKMQLSCT